MGADVGGSGPRQKKGGKKKAKRVPVRIDMTPMVDVAFLLLIFYMVTTVFRTPQALELSLPPDNTPPTQIAESKIMTVRVFPARAAGDDPRVFWHRGASKPEEIQFSQLPAILEREKNAVVGGPEELIVLIKIDRDATYDTMVRITDELGMAEVDKFSLVPLDDADRKAVPL
jgi:biopolymer transport protein ExbD